MEHLSQPWLSRWECKILSYRCGNGGQCGSTIWYPAGSLVSSCLSVVIGWECNGCLRVLLLPCTRGEALTTRGNLFTLLQLLCLLEEFIGMHQTFVVSDAAGFWAFEGYWALQALLLSRGERLVHCVLIQDSNSTWRLCAIRSVTTMYSSPREIRTLGVFRDMFPPCLIVYLWL